MQFGDLVSPMDTYNGLKYAIHNTYVASLHCHFNRDRLSIEAFFSQSKVIKKLSKWKKIG